MTLIDKSIQFNREKRKLFLTRSNQQKALFTPIGNKVDLKFRIIYDLVSGFAQCEQQQSIMASGILIGEMICLLCLLRVSLLGFETCFFSAEDKQNDLFVKLSLK